MTGSVSVVASLRSGDYRERNPDWVAAVAIVGLLLDVVTTWHVLVRNSYVELNPVINGLSNVHPLAGVAVMVIVNVALVFVSAHRLGWASTALAGYLIVTLGVFGGLNNLELFVRGGPSLLAVLGEQFRVSGSTVFWITDIVGISVGLTIARLRHGRLPWGEVTVITVATVLFISAGFLI